jgi:hypothetical protein
MTPNALYVGENPDIVGQEGYFSRKFYIDGAEGVFFPTSKPKQGYLVYLDELRFLDPLPENEDVPNEADELDTDVLDDYYADIDSDKTEEDDDDAEDFPWWLNDENDY